MAKRKSASIKPNLQQTNSKYSAKELKELQMLANKIVGDALSYIMENRLPGVIVTKLSGEISDAVAVATLYMRAAQHNETYFRCVMSGDDTYIAILVDIADDAGTELVLCNYTGDDHFDVIRVYEKSKGSNR